MKVSEPNISVDVDLTNPGQFFACCGLLELADRLWPSVEGWFEHDQFHINSAGNLNALLRAISTTLVEALDPEDNMASPMRLPAPIDLRLDWWNDTTAHGKRLKVWAGSMQSPRISRAMQHALADVPPTATILNFATVVHDPHQPKKKVEPYYFDSRRGWNAKSLDIGFAPDSLKMTTLAHPATEFLCLVGLQRFRPAATNKQRVFDYHTWSEPLPPVLAALATCGKLKPFSLSAYRFENAFRTDQKKHKSFLPATPIGENP